MTEELLILTLTAFSVAFIHTLLGPDHYLPFVVMAKARKWSMLKTIWITFVCGIGHVASSLLLGVIGIALGLAVTPLDVIESVRGELAAWALIAFGLVYFIWGLKKAYKNHPHSHRHDHGTGLTHDHLHDHEAEHSHLHEESGDISITPWLLFVIFVLGPCEPLIPILMYPAAAHGFYEVIWIGAVFGFVTVGTMLSAVVALSLGVKRLRLGQFEKFSHCLAGAAICCAGVAIQFLGL